MKQPPNTSVGKDAVPGAEGVPAPAAALHALNRPAEAEALRVLPPAVKPARAPATAARAKVLVMDEHPMVEEWISSVLDGEAEIVLKGHIPDLAEVLALVARSRPALTVIEIARDIRKGLETVAELRAKFPKMRLLVFSSCDEVRHSAEALRAGADGFVSKSAGRLEFVSAVRQVLHGDLHLSRAMIQHLSAVAAAVPPVPQTGPEVLLSPREMEVFEAIGNGLRPKEISQRIALSVKTVESYLARIREKLGLRDARDLFQTAVKWCKAAGK